MKVEHALAFSARTHEPPGLEIRVNFGIFAGREATPAEVDELGRVLLERVDQVSIISEERHEMAGDSEASLHQVRIEIADAALPADEHEADELRGRLLEVAERWAEACIADRHQDLSDI